jgi:hypothetical protein
MYRRKIFKGLGICSIICFVASTAFLFVLGLREVGVKWWVIFSLSGYSAILLFMVASLYAFAVFRSIFRSQKIYCEHPLTSRVKYMAFYNTSPLFGAFIGGILGIGRGSLLDWFGLFSVGCLSTTFFLWIVVDPVLGFMEMLLPSSRRHRRERLLEERTEKQQRKVENERMLCELVEKELSQEHLRETILLPVAEDMASLIANHRLGLKGVESQIVDKGVEAWQMGGIVCMRQLHKLTTEMLIERFGKHDMVDHISIWWDGIGKWRKPLIVVSR